MIEPTVGRVVHYRPSASDHGSMPMHHPQLAAIVCHVFNPRLVNLAVFDADGGTHPRLSVPLLQAGDAQPAPGSAYAEWMPYQKGQAAKTEALEERLADAQSGTTEPAAAAAGQ